MPRASTQTRRRITGAQPVRAASEVALLAEPGARERIGAILEERGWRFAAFEDVGDLLSRSDASPTLAADASPTLVLLWSADADFPPVQQIELLKRDLERAQIVVICADAQRWEVRAALAAGVAGMVLEDEMAGTLSPCLHAVRAGQICVPRQHWRQIEPPALSTREKQILGLVVMGYMNSQIAERLFLAESTVKSHLSSAFGKLGVRSRNEAVKLILDSEHGLGMGILGLGGEPLQADLATAR